MKSLNNKIMKKLIITTILFITIALNISAQVKVNYSVTNARYVGLTTWYIDVYATVPSGVTWKPGPTCIRINYYTIPANIISLVESNPVNNANTNISNNTNYENMTSTSIMGGQAASLNILPKSGQSYYTFATGSYLLGTLKFQALNTSSCINMSFIVTSAIFDQMTPLVYLSDWTKTDPPPCITDIKNENTLIPDKYNLSQNYPNPFNPTTSIKFSIPTNTFVKLTVFDLLGREISVLVNDVKSAGNYIVDFNASDLASGIYYYKIETKDFTEVKKMMIIK
jgi:hypothetical protein